MEWRVEEIEYEKTRRVGKCANALSAELANQYCIVGMGAQLLLKQLT